MKALATDIKGFLSTLNQIDFLLYIAVLFLIILVVSLIYIIKNSEDEEEPTKEKNNFKSNDIDLNEVLNSIENTTPSVVKYTPYEEEQEQKAIISYDELIEQNQNNNLYEEEIIDNNELSIKKIDLTKKIEMPVLPKTTDNNKGTNFEKEEEFLQNLKQFLKLLD